MNAAKSSKLSISLSKSISVDLNEIYDNANNFDVDSATSRSGEDSSKRSSLNSIVGQIIDKDYWLDPSFIDLSDSKNKKQIKKYLKQDEQNFAFDQQRNVQLFSLKSLKTKATCTFRSTFNFIKLYVLSIEFLTTSLACGVFFIAGYAVGYLAD
jgi:hypothetical protein